MIRIENTEVFGWKSAVRGMRNPMNSWKNSDSMFNLHDDYNNITVYYEDCQGNEKETVDKMTISAYEHGSKEIIGENDLKLMEKLALAGTDHRKFMRFICVNCDIVAPMYWWKEFDTYKVGTVRNSCSTMHKIHDKEFTMDDFSHEHLGEFFENGNNRKYGYMDFESALSTVINMLNVAREKFIENKNKEYWWQMIQSLPSSYNQRSTVQLNYEVLRNMYHARKHHKLDEWQAFCKWVEHLPYSGLITKVRTQEEKKNDAE